VDTAIARVVHATPEVMFQLAARVEDWPRLLPHYRWVRVIGPSRAGRLVEMAARRDVVGRIGVPLRWTAIQTLHPESTRIEFQHVAGITRGMWVEWSITASAAGSDVQIRHVFRPKWRVPEPLIQAVVGEYFVNGVARRTLAHLAQRAEDPA
jgi:ribosome-associated toxin RatA of RatAB toxin-antitoxin module